MEPTRKYVDRFLAEASTIIDEIDKTQISLVVEQLQKVKQRSGRIFFWDQAVVLEMPLMP